MAQFLLLLTGALVVGAIVFGIAVLVTGGEGLGEIEPDGRSAPLPVARPLIEGDLESVRFDTAIRGYRMAQVDRALRRVAYDIGYKDELIQVLEAEVAALREGRLADADSLRDARWTAVGGAAPTGGSRATDGGDAPAGDAPGGEDAARSAPPGDPSAGDAPVGEAGAADASAVAGDGGDGPGDASAGDDSGAVLAGGAVGDRGRVDADPGARQ